MRLQELILKVRNGEVRVGFHPRLTLVSGLGHGERRHLAEAIADALLGGAQTSQITYVDDAGRRVRAMCADGRLFAEYEGGLAAPSPLAAIGQRNAPLRDILVPPVGANQLPESESLNPEIGAARAVLLDLDARVREARSQQALVHELRSEISVTTRNLERARRSSARREHERVVAELGRVRLEWQVVHGEVDEHEEADSVLLLSADRARRLAECCLDARARASTLLAALEDAPPVTTHDLTAVDIPEREPAHLAPVLHRWTEVAQRRARVLRRLAELARQGPPDPSEPAVARLATVRPEELRDAVDRALSARAALEAAQVELGGAEVEDTAVATPVEEVEAAHGQVVAAQQERDRLRLPGLAGASALLVLAGLALRWHPVAALVAAFAAAAVAAVMVRRPARLLRRARQDEQRCLADVDAASYLGFHLRRVHASLDPGLAERARRAVEDHREAVASWIALTSDVVSPERAATLVDEVAWYRRAIQEQGGAVARARALRHQLEHELDPILRSIRDQLSALCARYRIDPAQLDRGPDSFRALIAQQVELGKRVRNVIRLRQAIDAERAATTELDALFVVLGIEGTGVRPRMEALEQLARAAEDREAARRTRRTAEEVDANLARLQQREAELRQPDFVTAPPLDGDLPDVESLRSHLDELRQRLGVAERSAREASRLWERREAMIRRISVLTATAGSGTTLDADGSKVYERVAALLAAAAAGEQGSTIPVVLDEPLELVAVDRRWDLLDFVLRASSRHQVIYLTGDPFVAAWARERRGVDLLELVEAGSDPEIAVDRNLGHVVMSTSAAR